MVSAKQNQDLISEVLCKLISEELRDSNFVLFTSSKHVLIFYMSSDDYFFASIQIGLMKMSPQSTQIHPVKNTHIHTTHACIRTYILQYTYIYTFNNLSIKWSCLDSLSFVLFTDQMCNMTERRGVGRNRQTVA